MRFGFSCIARLSRLGALVLFLGCAVGAGALEVPPLRGRVNDYAGLLGPRAVRNLEQSLEQLERQDSTQVVVLTIPSLEGADLEEFCLTVAEAWKIGHENRDNGALFVVVQNDRKMRIEVGYGLEGRLTDLLAGRILDQEVRPLFRAGRFEEGIVAGTVSIIQAVQGEYQAGPHASRGGRGRQGQSRGNGVVVLLFFVMVIGTANRLAGGLAGAVLLPLAFGLLLGPGLVLLLLVPFGFLLGLGAPSLLLGAPRRGYYYGGGFGGGFRGGGGGLGGGFGGGFRGGGGGFGGGGASGSW